MWRYVARDVLKYALFFNKQESYLAILVQPYCFEWGQKLKNYAPNGINAVLPYSAHREYMGTKWPPPLGIHTWSDNMLVY